MIHPSEAAQITKSKLFDILHGVNPVMCPLCDKPTKVEMQFCADRGKYTPNLNHYSLGAHLIGSSRITGEFPLYWHCAWCFSKNGFLVFHGTVYLRNGVIKGYHLQECNKTYRMVNGKLE